MSKDKRLLCIVIFTFFITLWIGGLSPALSSNYKMTGILTAVNLSARVVVIEVDLNRGQFTVAGPLMPHAKLFRFGRYARLEEFKIGEPVDVEWHRTTAGHVIDRLLQ